MKLLRETIRRLLLESAEEAKIASVINSDDYQTIKQGLDFAETLGYISNLEEKDAPWHSHLNPAILFDFEASPSFAKEIFKGQIAITPNFSSSKPYAMIVRRGGNQIRITVSKP